MEHKLNSNMNDKKTNDLKLVQKYWDEAKTKLWQQYHVDPFGREQGEYKWWCEGGQIGIISNFKDGVVHGKHQEWWNDETRWYIETYHFKRRKHGTKIRFKYGK